MLLQCNPRTLHNIDAFPGAIKIETWTRNYTETALLTVQNVSMVINKPGEVVLALHDSFGAFINVDHSIPLHRLRVMVIGDSAFQWFRTSVDHLLLSILHGHHIEMYLLEYLMDQCLDLCYHFVHNTTGCNSIDAWTIFPSLYLSKPLSPTIQLHHTISDIQNKSIKFIDDHQHAIFTQNEKIICGRIKK